MTSFHLLNILLPSLKQRKNKMKIVIFGGDGRFVASALYFKNKGYDAKIYAFDRERLKELGAEELYTDDISDAGAVLFPLPLSVDGEHVNCPYFNKKIKVESALDMIGHGTSVYGGMVSKFHKKFASERGIRITDYYEDEDLQIKNAVPTAEGAIEIFMRNTRITVFKSKVVILGFGKIAKALSSKLLALGADVTVAARGVKDLSVADTFGVKTACLDKFLYAPCDADCIFNTVPHNIISPGSASLIDSHTLYIELASSPYGMSDAAKSVFGGVYVAAPSLPGKYAPVTAGNIIAESVCKYI